MRRGEAKRVQALETQVADLAAQLAETQRLLGVACLGIVELDRTKQAIPSEPESIRFTVNTREGVDLWSVSQRRAVS